MIQSNIKLKGEPSAQALASGLATLGRYGDDYMVHAAEGETFVPKEILEANPDLKDQLFNQMRSMGIKEPNRYVVGNALNSINPITGQPEFFFKKIFRAIKKVFKKVLPVAAPIIGNFIAPGIGGLIASGLTAKLQGGSWGDALKAAGMAYAGGALTQGIMGGINAAPGGFGAGFTKGLTSGAMAPFQAAGNLFSTSGGTNPLSQGIFGGNYSAGKEGFMDYLVPSYNPAGTGTQTVQGGFTNQSGTDHAALGPKPGGAARIMPVEKGGPGQMGMTKGFGEPKPQFGDFTQTELNADLGPKTINAPSANLGKPVRILTQNDRPVFYDYTNVAPPELSNVASSAPQNATFDLNLRADPYKTGASILPTAEQNLMTNVDAELNPPTFMDKAKKFASDKLMSKEVLGPIASAGIPAALAYAMAPDEVTEEDEAAMTNPQRSAYEQYKAGKASNPDFANTPQGQSLLRQAGITPTRTAEELSRSTGVSLADAQRYMSRKYGVTNAAGGGEITGPGTGRSDSIPAMLSDGEFVMTAQAVKNAGNGNRDLGAARMYDMMNKFERAV